MKISEIKKQMLGWRDFYGGDIMYTDEIEEAKTKKELAAIIEKYRSHLIDMSTDADSHLDRFKKRIGLTLL